MKRGDEGRGRGVECAGCSEKRECSGVVEDGDDKGRFRGECETKSQRPPLPLPPGAFLDMDFGFADGPFRSVPSVVGASWLCSSCSSSAASLSPL